MTEAEWLRYADPAPMLAFLKVGAGARKLRLFAVACARQVWDLLTDVRGRRAVEVAERFADGLLSSDDLAWAREGALQAANNAFVNDDALATIPLWAVTPGPEEAAGLVSVRVLYVAKARQLEESLAAYARRGPLPPERNLRREQADLLRDLFGNPFRAPSFAPSWLAWNENTVVKLATAIYEERRFGDLPILADALEDAGCGDPDILAHCRGAGVHVRGCWVLDACRGVS